jgi:hypothetical protein
MNSKYEVQHENLTYEEIASLYETTPNKIHMMVKRTYNKIITGLVKDKGVNIWEAVMATKDFFGMSEKEAIDKLNPNNKSLIERYAETAYTDGKVNSYDDDSIEQMFD